MSLFLVALFGVFMIFGYVCRNLMQIQVFKIVRMYKTIKYANWSTPSIKHTFIHFDILEKPKRRCKSAPPNLFAHCMQEEKKQPCRKKIKRSRKTVIADDDEHALREFAAQARADLWYILARRLLRKNQRAAMHWSRLSAAIVIAFSTPKKRATLTRQAFEFVARSGASWDDFVSFHKIGIMKCKHEDSVEIWISDDLMTSPKMRMLLDASQKFMELLRKCQAVLWLPQNVPLAFPWSHDYPIATLQAKAFLACGIHPREQRVMRRKQSISQATLGEAGILPGDIIDIFQNPL